MNWVRVPAGSPINVALSASRLGYRTLNPETLGSNPTRATTEKRLPCACGLDDFDSSRHESCYNCRNKSYWDSEDGEVAMPPVSGQASEIESVLSADSISDPSNPFEHLPTEVGAHNVDAYIEELRRLDPQVRKAFATCVVWIGAGGRGRSNNSHGGVIRRHDRAGKPVSLKPSKYVWQAVNGALVPEGMIVGHSCADFGCINPGHLVVGFRAAVYLMFAAQGRYDKISAERTATHCKQGHPIKGNNVVEWKQSKGDMIRRRCKLCSQRESREGNRRRNGAVPRKERRHPDLSNPEQLCGNGLHHFTAANTLVYWNKTYKTWYKNCRMCTNKRARLRKRVEHGFAPAKRYENERFVT